MKIVLVGEYSRLHNSLKEALVTLGHEVVLIGTGDGFKDFPVDHNIDAAFLKSGMPNIIRQAIFRIFRYDIAGFEYAYRFKKMLPLLTGFDVVQLISETPLFAPLSIEYSLLKQLRDQNKKMFVLCSGTDYSFMKAASERKFRYSLFDPYLDDKAIAFEYHYALPHLRARFERHHNKLMALARGIIATDIDYAMALADEPKYLGMIPNPVNTRKIAYTAPDVSGQIVIFHGINRWNYHKKGNRYFEKALEIIATQFGGKVKIITAENQPYEKYIRLYDSAHIVLDQVYAYDQGYNALEAMAKGKVVFTGAEIEFERHYGLTQRVAVNALPDADRIAEELTQLILNPQEIAAIGRRARAFIEREHDYLKVAKRYLSIWESRPKATRD